MRLKNPTLLDSGLETLRRMHMECGNLLNAHGTLRLRDDYLTWVDNTERQFNSLFADSTLSDGLHSTPYWEIRRLTEETPRPYPLVEREVTRQARRIEEAMAELTRLKTFLDRPGDIVVPDSSALVEGVYFDQFDWAAETGLAGPVRLVIPILVVEELDKIKDRERGRPQKRARSVVRRLRELARAVPAGEPVPFRDGAAFEVLLDDAMHSRFPSNDVEIIDQALGLQSLTGGDVLLACADAAMEFRARLAGLKVFDMPLPEENE